MRPEFWHERWSAGRIGFHQSATDRLLSEYWAQAAAARGGRVFVPLCGKSLDLLWLRDRGYEVTGVELSDIAVQAFFLQNGIAARRRVTPVFDVYEAANLQLLRGNFFDLTTARLGPVAAVYDRAALISWSPELRAPYVEHITALTSAGATTLLITLEYRQAQMPGPPFSVDRHEVVRLYSRGHEIQELARRDVLASEPRMQARGVSKLVETCYRLVRRSP
jgi:thiopurine S-methyltransferase